MLLLICVLAILVGASVKRAAVYREREREREVVASIVTAACGEISEYEVVASTLHCCIFLHSDSWSLRTPVVFPI